MRRKKVAYYSELEKVVFAGPNARVSGIKIEIIIVIKVGWNISSSAEITTHEKAILYQNRFYRFQIFSQT